MKSYFTAHPKGLWILCIGRLFDTFSYFGNQTILALYMMHVFRLDRSTAYVFYGAYAAFVYALPLLGGVVADKWLGGKKTLMMGYGLSIVGNLFMIAINSYTFCLGLSLSALGLGCSKGNSTHLVGTLYQTGEVKKESAFTWFYLAMNIGGALAPFTYGLIIYHIGWNIAFLASAMGTGLSAFLLWKNGSLFQETFLASSLTVNKVCIAMVMISFLISLAFYFSNVLSVIIVTSFLIGVGYIIFKLKAYQGEQRRQLISLMMICFFGMFYFAGGLQAGSSMTLFIQHKIQEGQIHFVLPSSVFNTLYCVFVVLLAPAFAYLWSRLKASQISVEAMTKVTLGIVFAGLGMLLCALAATDGQPILLYVVLSYVCLSAGEIVLTPTAYTLMSDRAPVEMKSTLMGCWFSSVAMGGYLSGVLANSANWLSHILLPHSNEFLGDFLLMAGFMFLMAIILIILKPWLRNA